MRRGIWDVTLQYPIKLSAINNPFDSANKELKSVPGMQTT